MLVVPEHDRLHGPWEIVTSGAVHRATQARPATERHRFPTLATMPQRMLSVLIGGIDKTYRLTVRRVRQIADALAGMLGTRGGSVFVSPSRRIGKTGLGLPGERLNGLSTTVRDRSGESRCFAYPALADAVLVTADLISMTSKAAATGKPVRVFDLNGGDAKFALFHETIQAAGITRSFFGHIESWSFSILADTARAGAALRAFVLGRRQRA